MIFASEAFSQKEVDAVLTRDYAPALFFKAHDNFIKSVIQLPEKSKPLLSETEDWDRDAALYRDFKNAIMAPRLYTLGGNAEETDVFGKDTPHGWNYGYWVSMYNGVKDASEAFLVDVGLRNGGKLPTISSTAFTMHIADLAICTAQLYQGYMDVLSADDYFRKEAARKKTAAKTEDEIKSAIDTERYADRMMLGVSRMLHFQTGLPAADTESMAEAMASEKRRFAAEDAAKETPFFKEYL